MTSETTIEPGAARREEGLMASQTFELGELVSNFPLGLGRTDVVVEGVVADVIEDGSPVIAAMFRGEYVRFVADVAKTVAQ